MSFSLTDRMGFSLTMDPVPPRTEPAGQTPVPRRSPNRALAVLVVLVILLGGGLLVLSLAPTPRPRMVWLTPTEVARARHVGSLTRLRYRLMNLTAPLWRWYWSRKPQLLINLRLQELDRRAADQSALGTPIATNALGMRAWVLSAAESATWQQRLKPVPGPRSHRTAVSTLNGTPVSVSVGVSSQPGPLWTVNLRPKVVSGMVSLLIDTTLTEPEPATPGKTSSVRTNFNVACRVLVPNGGGLVIDGGQVKPGGGEDYWVIVAPSATDPLGRPIKP